MFMPSWVSCWLVSLLCLLDGGVYKALGIGAEDVAAARLVLEKARR